MIIDFYNTIDQTSTAEFKDRGSRFIAYAFPFTAKEMFKEKLSEVKKEHPKASHHCFAYRIGTDGNNFRSGDDGEPSGSAGKPILGQIDSARFNQCVQIGCIYGLANNSRCAKGGRNKL
jgi:putative IMPACT (imprinted ancient) family translation regulator